MPSKERQPETPPGRYPEVHLNPAKIAEEHLSAMITAAGQLADNCEHLEHNEGARCQTTAIGDSLRQTASRMAHQAGFSLGQLYAVRIWGVESSSSLRFVGSLDRVELSGFKIMMEARTWLQFQIGQIVHDRQFHPDVFGLEKREQMRHYSFHVTKLVWLMDRAARGDFPLDKFYATRTPDIALFGIKLATLFDQELPDEPIDAVL